MKKKSNIFENNRQLELLEKYYSLDREKKVMNLTLHYEKASDMLNVNVSNNGRCKFNSDTLELIDEVISNSPNGYKINVEFVIDDYEEYDPNILIESFNDTLEIAQYSSRKQRTWKEFTSAVLILVGVLLLLFKVIGENNKWFGEGVQGDIVSEIVDISAWVFIWEAVTLLFLEHSSSSKLNLAIMRKVSTISMYTQNKETLLVSEESKNIFKDWEGENKAKRVGKYMLILSSVVLIVLSVYSILSLITLDYSQLNNVEIITTVIFGIVFSLFRIFGGIAGILLFINNNNKLSKVGLPFAIIMIVLLVIAVIECIVLKDTGSIINVVSSSVIVILYFVGFFMNKYLK